MMRSFFVCASLVVGATAVIAQADVITERKQIMRGNGAATRTGTQMIRNEVPFDAAKAREVFSGIAAGMDRFPNLFPEGSQSGSQPTRAAPTIWSDNAGFRAAAAKIVQEAQQAAASTTDLASFQANFQRVTANCNTCHEKYRTPQ